MNKKNIIFIIVGVVLLLICLVWKWAVTTTSPKYTGPVDKVTLQLKWLHQAQFAGYYAAAQRGFYRDEGLDVSILPVGKNLSEVDIVDSLVKNDIDFGVVGGDQVLAGRSMDKPIKAIAVIYQQSPVVLAAAQKSGIKNLSDLIGKKMGVEKGQNTETIYRAMMKRASVDMSRVRELSVPPGLGPMINGQIDARMIYLTNEGISAREQNFPVSFFYPDDYGLQVYADTLISSDSLIKKNPDLVRRFVRASLKGWNWAVAYPAEASMFSLIYNPNLSSSHELAMMNTSLPFVFTGTVDIGDMATSTWKNMQDVLSGENGLIKTSFPIETAFTTQFL